jgi:hypothetical protein
MRMKVPSQWIEKQPNLLPRLVRIQALWRGYSARNWMRLAGPGVLKRSLCHNDDEMVTMDGKAELSPLDYFSITQDGKVWWFDVRSMLDWARKNVAITNPFNRQPLTVDDTRRLRELGYNRERRKLSVTHTDPPLTLTLLEARDEHWVQVVQVLVEHGFTDLIHPEHYIGMTYGELRLFVYSLTEDTRWWMYDGIGEKDPYLLHSKRAKCHTWLRALRNTMHTYDSLAHLGNDTAQILLASIKEFKNPLEFVFFILTATVRTQAVAAAL